MININSKKNKIKKESCVLESKPWERREKEEEEEEEEKREKLKGK